MDIRTYLAARVGLAFKADRRSCRMLVGASFLWVSYELMDINKMLVELRAERENVEQAIITLERLAAGRGKRRGRPPA